MKIIKIVIFSFLGLIVLLAVSAVILIKTFDVNRYKPQILAEAGKALGRKVDYQKAFLGVSLFQGVSLKISGLSIAEDHAFGKDDFFFVREISAGVDVLGYLLQKKVSISGIVIDSFRVNIIRDKEGSINAQTLAKPVQAGKELVKASPAVASIAIPAVMISEIKVLNGQAIYIDRSFDPAIRFEVKQINVGLSKVSLTRDFPFTVSASVLSDKKNINVQGKVQIDLKSNQATISGLKGTLELANILLENIPKVFPQAKGAVLPKSLAGSLNFEMGQLTAGPNGLGALTAKAVLTDGSLKFQELANPIQNIAAKVNITENKISLDQASFNIGQGLITVTAALDDYLAKQDYSAQAEIKDLRLQDLLLQERSPVKAEGVAAAKLKIKGSGFSPEALKNTLSGNADIAVVKAKLKDLNVLRTVLDKISILPGLAQRIEAGLPDKYKQKLAGKDTVLSDIKLPLVIENGRLVISDLSLGGEEFLFKGSGQSGFSGDYSLEGALFIPQDLSASMVIQVPELGYLQDENKLIFIPLKVSGNAKETKFKVDGQYIAQKMIQNQARQQIFKALEKAGGSQSSGAGAEDQQNAVSGREPGSKAQTEEVVGSILRGIFK